MATNSNRIKKKAMLDALEKCFGIVTKAAKIAGIDRCTHYKWCNSDEKYKEAVEDIQNVALDFAEDKLITNINNGSDTAIIFYLKTKGKARGYIEKVEQNVTLNKVGLDAAPVETYE